MTGVLCRERKISRLEHSLQESEKAMDAIQTQMRAALTNLQRENGELTQALTQARAAVAVGMPAQSIKYGPASPVDNAVMEELKAENQRLLAELQSVQATTMTTPGDGSTFCSSGRLFITDLGHLDAGLTHLRSDRSRGHRSADCGG